MRTKIVTASLKVNKGITVYSLLFVTVFFQFASVNASNFDAKKSKSKNKDNNLTELLIEIKESNEKIEQWMISLGGFNDSDNSLKTASHEREMRVEPWMVNSKDFSNKKFINENEEGGSVIESWMTNLKSFSTKHEMVDL